MAGQLFPFVAREAGVGAASLAPMVPLTLVGTRTVATSGLLDTGAANVDAVPVILGQINFFLEFDVCFFRSRQQFEVRVRAIGGAGDP